MAGGIKYQYARLSVSEKLIAINIVVFIVFGLLGKVAFPALQSWFELPSDFMAFLGRPWSIVTYSFLHGGIFHLLWNMYVLYIAGKIALNLFDGRRLLNIYFLGVMLGGMFYMLTNSIFYDGNGVLIGASAGVIAVLIFVCTYIPNQEVRLIFFNVKLWHIGVGVVLIDLLQISSGGDNIGGRIAHLGGALLGYVYAKQLVQGRDIGAGFSNFIDSIVNTFKSTEKQAPLKTVYKKQKSNSKSNANSGKDAHQRKIDSILDKISKSGYESLSKAEKDFLFKAGKED